ncbi:MAG: hypothetical protein V1725_00475 [archaeon]
MAKVVITPLLRDEIEKRFKAEAVKIFSLLDSLRNNPKKGQTIGAVGNIIIKELKYKKFRFYFLADRYKIVFRKIEELKDLLIKVVRMSEKNNQQKTIDEIKNILRALGEAGF